MLDADLAQRGLVEDRDRLLRGIAGIVVSEVV